MSPLFACSGCGLQIERALRLYLQNKGHVLCSSCIDRLEREHQVPAEPNSATPDTSAHGVLRSCHRV